ncbi:interleukin 2 receptor, gamma b isoform X1 [Erpetoichthys calabaricus]|uniref:Interleukin 2 receptor, gamma b n=1 Tax=Erpetoichthys calabaricus TaxID=27687 RepID=A0A8C4SQB1_ERPCA|nr:interleukin 2 receptor, gamma b isoform X1 [Erpetoichthys calabaricus]
MALGVILVIVAEFLQVVHTEGLAKPNISCIIYNQEYTQCMWSEHEVPQINYTFFRKYKKTMQYSECSQYIQKKEYNTGCKLEFNPDLKFSNFQVNLSSPKNSVQWDYTFQLKEKVLMNPPVNISVTSSSDNDINLTWNIPVTLKKGCLVSQVKYKNNKDVQWQTSPEIFKQTQFNLPFADESLLYEFYVKITVHSNCGGSSFWSDWSKPVYWGSNKSESLHPTEVTSFFHGYVFKAIICPVMGSAILLFLVCMLAQNERLRIILVPVIPNPGKNFEDLFGPYNGNFQEWMHISKDVVEGFKPNYTEPVWPVMERMESSHEISPEDRRTSNESQGSDCVLLIDNDEDDSMSTSSTSTSSTLPAPPYDEPLLGDKESM